MKDLVCLKLFLCTQIYGFLRLNLCFFLTSIFEVVFLVLNCKGKIYFGVFAFFSIKTLN